MEFEDAEFKFALEAIIASRNENGATLSEIRGLLLKILCLLRRPCFFIKMALLELFQKDLFYQSSVDKTLYQSKDIF